MSSFSASIDLPPVTSSVPLARRLVRDVLRMWDAPQDRVDAELLVTELVANVVDHADVDVLTLEIALAGAWLRIGVVDGSAIRPVVRELSVAEERGRGMQLVAGIADRWGAEDHAGGKRVWFELSPVEEGEPAGLPPQPAGDGPGDSNRGTKESSPGRPTAPRRTPTRRARTGTARPPRPLSRAPRRTRRPDLGARARRWRPGPGRHRRIRALTSCVVPHTL